MHTPETLFAMATVLAAALRLPPGEERREMCADALFLASVTLIIPRSSLTRCQPGPGELRAALDHLAQLPEVLAAEGGPERVEWLRGLVRPVATEARAA